MEKKDRLGDFEIDLVIGKNHKEALLTANDRATGVSKIKKIQSKDAQIVKQAFIELLNEFKPILQTITSDNGKEFSGHQDIARQLDIDYYFANLNKSWERGANGKHEWIDLTIFSKSNDLLKNHKRTSKNCTR